MNHCPKSQKTVRPFGSESEVMDLRGAIIHSGGPELKAVGGMLTDAHLDRRLKFDANAEPSDGQKKRRKLPSYLENKIGCGQLWVIYGELHFPIVEASKFVASKEVLLEIEDFYFLVTKLKTRNSPPKGNQNLGMAQNIHRVIWAFCGVCNPSEKQQDKLMRLQDKKTLTDYFIDTTKTLFEMNDVQTVERLRIRAEEYGKI